MISAKTIVQTAEGIEKQFGDFASKFIVAHPKTSVIIGAAVGAIAGFLLRL